MVHRAFMSTARCVARSLERAPCAASTTSAPGIGRVRTLCRGALRGLVRAVTVAVLVGGAHAAEGARTAVRVDLHAANAPLASALAHLGGADGVAVHVAEDIRDRLSGRLTGEADELVELLADTHGLSVYRDGTDLWFDRAERRVVDFVRLDEAALVAALKALAHPVGVGGTAVVDASGKGLVLSGTRAYVQSSLERIALAGALPDGTGDAAGGDGLPHPTSGAAAALGEAQRPELAAATRVPSDGARRLALDDEAALIDALGARVALVSARAPRYVELDDGTRVAPGERLPSGQRLLAVAPERVLFERDGVQTILALR